MKNGIRVLVGATMLVASGLSATSAEAAIITQVGICGTGESNLGDCTKSASFDTDTNILTIILTNTSAAANGGFLTADAFDLYANGVSGTVIVVTAFSSTNSNFQLFQNGPFATPPPGGDDRTTMIGIDGTWLGGNPANGLGVGQSATFTLTLATALTQATLDAAFFSEDIRFAGFVDGGSDKVPIISGGGGGEGGGGGNVPEPASVTLFGLGLLGAAWRARKQRVVS